MNHFALLVTSPTADFAAGLLETLKMGGSWEILATGLLLAGASILSLPKPH